MINPVPSESDVEDWFIRHAGEAGNASELSLRQVALWIPIIGLPANDD